MASCFVCQFFFFLKNKDADTKKKSKLTVTLFAASSNVIGQQSRPCLMLFMSGTKKDIKVTN